MARLHELGRGLVQQQAELGAEAIVPHKVIAEMLFRKIEVLAAPPPPTAEELEAALEDPKKKKPPPAKGKGKDDKVEDVLTKPKGVLILGYPLELAQHVAWEFGMRGHQAPLLRTFDRDDDLQARLSSVLAPWWIEEDSGVPEDLTVYSLGQDAEPAPVRMLRMRYPEHAALTDVLIKLGSEASSLEAAEAELAHAGNTAGEHDGEKPPKLRLEGYDKEVSAVKNIVDQVWLYENTQVLSTAFCRTASTLTDITIAAREADEENSILAETPEENCYRQMLEIVTRWLRPPDPEAAAAPEGEAVEGEEGVAGLAAEGDEEGGEAIEGEDPPDSAGAKSGRSGRMSGGHSSAGRHSETQQGLGGISWDTLGEEVQLGLRDDWLECLGDYLTGLQQGLARVYEEAADFNSELSSMQRSFLDFLQRDDQKPRLLADWLAAWPQKVAQGKVDPEELAEVVDDLSDQLWQLTDERRAEALHELGRLVESGFWERHASGFLRLAETLHGIEYGRYRGSISIMGRAYNEAAGELGLCAPTVPEQLEGPRVPEGNLTVEELKAWLGRLTRDFAGAPLDFADGITGDADQLNSTGGGGGGGGG